MNVVVTVACQCGDDGNGCNNHYEGDDDDYKFGILVIVAISVIFPSFIVHNIVLTTAL